MKIIKQGVNVAIISAFFITAAVKSFAVEGLQVSLQSSNVILSWPSDPSESYIVQYRPTVGTNDSWQPLTNQYPADTSGTNVTYFIHTNAAQYGTSSTNSGGGTNSGPALPGGGGGGTGGTNGVNIAWVPGTGYYQVVREGVHILGQNNLTNQALSGTITLAFEAGNDVGSLYTAIVQGDGVHFTGADSLTAPPVYPWTFSVDTAYFDNGSHTLQVQVDWLNPDISDVNNFTFDQWSDPLTITVSNAISYPNWEPEIGELGSSAYFAETVYTNANWSIDIYDTSNHLAQTLTGQATNGIIEGYWDMQDTNGIFRTNAALDPAFNATITVTPTNSAAVSKTAPKKKQRANNFPTQGSWVIAYESTFAFMLNSNAYYNAIYAMGSVGQQFGGAYAVFPSTNITNGQTFPLRYPSASTNAAAVTAGQMLQDDIALRSLLSNTNMRNFYYNGHGYPDGFSFSMSSTVLAAYVTHYYRFVFMDACLTASGSVPKSFGIPYNNQVPLTYFQQTGLRPRAFLGYTQNVSYCYLGSYTDPATGAALIGQVPQGVTDFLNNFEFYWYFNYDLSDAVFNGWVDSSSLPSGWSNGQSLQIYGYAGLGVDDYNQKTDWTN